MRRKAHLQRSVYRGVALNPTGLLFVFRLCVAVSYAGVTTGNSADEFKTGSVGSCVNFYAAGGSQYTASIQCLSMLGELVSNTGIAFYVFDLRHVEVFYFHMFHCFEILA